MEKEQNELIEKVIEVKRVAKVLKGGRRFSFSALVVVGDGKGSVGLALGKANEVTEAVRKATEKAKKEIKPYMLYKNTIPHSVYGHAGAARVFMQPSPPGSGVISSGPIRLLIEAIGISDINIKSLGSNNAHNMVNAALNGLDQLCDFSTVAERRGKKVEDVCYMEY